MEQAYAAASTDGPGKSRLGHLFSDSVMSTSGVVMSTCGAVSRSAGGPPPSNTGVTTFSYTLTEPRLDWLQATVPGLLRPLVKGLEDGLMAEARMLPRGRYGYDTGYELRAMTGPWCRSSAINATDRRLTSLRPVRTRRCWRPICGSVRTWW